VRRLLIGFCLAAVLTAQEQPVIRVSTRLVEVDVVVHDKNGPVTDLSQDDFSILDQGKPQKVSTFSLVSARSSEGAVPLRPGEVSNRLNRSGHEALGVTAILFDGLNTGPADQAYGREQTLKYLNAVPQGELLALFTLGQQLRFSTGFTDDRDRLIRAVSGRSPINGVAQGADQLASEAASSLSSGGDSIESGMAQNAIEKFQQRSMKDRAEMTVEALQTISKHMASLPGRKKLLWITAAFSAAFMQIETHNGQQTHEYTEFGEEINRAVHALNDANIAVYPIDPRDPYNAGLLAPGIDSMNLFAGGTGGQAFYNISDLVTAMRTVVEDSEATYSLGFYPTDVTLDGKYHSLRVKVDRKGVDLRYRKGYVASDERPPSEQKRKESMNDIFNTPLEATAVGIRAMAVRDPARPGNYQLELRLNFNELHVEREQNKWVALIEVATQLPAKKPPNGTVEDIKITLTDARLAQVLRDGFLLRRPFLANGQRGDLRVVVQDRVTGAAGSVKLQLPGS
jgi:VWFA-related protein